MNVNMIKYKDLFSDSILQLFGENKNKIGNLELNPEADLKIDVDRIIEIEGFITEEEILNNKSGQYNSKDNIIKIDLLEPSYRQRFTKAHELGYAVLQHDGISNRIKDSLEGKQIELNERAANQFAAELLMPKKLVKIALKLYIKQYESKELENISVSKVICDLADRFNLSRTAVKFRLINLGFIEY